MKKQKFGFVLLFILLSAIVSPVLAQDSKKQAIFAVLNDGRSLEPIVQVENGKLVENQSVENFSWDDFIKTNYKPKTSYNLIFGGVAAGKVTVIKSAPDSDCATNMAEVSSETTKTKLGGMVMALATNAPLKTANGLRRAPTAAERAEIEKLVRAEYTKQKNSAAVLKTMRSHNLTALDVDGDGKVEFVGSYWVETSKTGRGLLFFIAQKESGGKYAFSHSEYNAVEQKDVMSGNIKDIDTGIYNELLLDAFDYDGDGVSEIFTIGRAFEGNNFNVYRRENGKWTLALETYNYHCGY